MRPDRLIAKNIAPALQTYHASFSLHAGCTDHNMRVKSSAFCSVLLTCPLFRVVPAAPEMFFGASGRIDQSRGAFGIRRRDEGRQVGGPIRVRRLRSPSQRRVRPRSYNARRGSVHFAKQPPESNSTAYSPAGPRVIVILAWLYPASVVHVPTTSIVGSIASLGGVSS